jgi:hypothetical protein
LQIHTFHAVIVSISAESASKFLRFRREKHGVPRLAPLARRVARRAAPQETPRAGRRIEN